MRGCFEMHVGGVVLEGMSKAVWVGGWRNIDCVCR